MSAETTLPPEERRARVNALLRQVDEAVRKHDLDGALDKIRKVYEFDLKNMYARAFEERILVMILEKEREQLKREAEAKAAQGAELEVKRRIKDFYRQQDVEAQLRKQQEKVEQELEQRAREASVSEQRKLTEQEFSSVETVMRQRVAELEQRFAEQMRQTLDIERRRLEGESRQHLGEIRLSIEPTGQVVTRRVGDESLEQLRIEYEAKLLRVKEQVEHETQQRLESERTAIREETFQKLSEEHTRTQEELVRKTEEDRNAAIMREQARARETQLNAYQAMMVLTIRLKLSSETEEAILKTLRTSFSIEDEEHEAAKKAAHRSAYVEAVREMWKKGKPFADEQLLLENLMSLYQIPAEDHQQIERGVKKELGIPDEHAVIFVIDDDASILRFIEYILKKTYRTVLSAKSAEKAVAVLQQATPSLILCDVQMPGMSGFAFFEKIQQGEYGDAVKTVPFLLMSALADEFFVKTAKQLGVKSYIAKPFTKEVLEKSVREALA